MDTTKEIPLKGGRSTEGVVRIENTVHRPLSERSQFTHSLLKLLEENNFPYSPRFLGIDDKGREVLTYIDGNVPSDETDLTAANLVQCATALKALHTITAGSDLAGGSEVVCHNDFAPWNVIVKNGDLVGVIDFDDAAPGERLEDVAYFIWTFLEIGSDINPRLQAKNVKLICDTYGLSDRQNLVDAILKQQEKILRKRIHLSENDSTQEARDFSKAKINIINSEIEWVKKNKQYLSDSI